MSNGQQSEVKHRTTASDAAIEFYKHLITLASAVLVLSGTLIPKATVTVYKAIPLMAAWLSLFYCLYHSLSGISTIIISRANDNNDWLDDSSRGHAVSSRRSFFLGLILFAVFAGFSIVSSIQVASETEQPNNVIIRNHYEGTTGAAEHDTVPSTLESSKSDR